MALAEKSESSVRSRRRVAAAAWRGRRRRGNRASSTVDGNGVGGARLDAADAHLLGPQPEPDAMAVGARAEPHGTSSASGPTCTRPGAATTASQACSSRRRNRRRRRWPGGRRSPPALPTCSTRPRFITTMRSAMASASSWSWVTMMVVTPSRRCSDLISSRRRTRTRASSADSGSSSSSSEGEEASARASATRCCWPPESCAGYLAPCSGMPTSCQQLADAGGDLARGLAAVDEAVADVLRPRSGWGTARRTGRRCRSRAAPAAAATRRGRRSRRARVLRLEAGDDAQQRGLAAARGTEEAHELAALDLERDGSAR